MSHNSEMSPASGVITPILDWWKNDDADYRYLAAASDLAELERRSRLLESDSNGAIWVTFNH